MNKKKEEWPALDVAIYVFAILAVMISVPFVLVIILDDGTPGDIRLFMGLFLAGTSVAWYYTGLKHNKELD